MIEKMAYVSVVGPKDELCRITDGYLCRYDIDLENAALNLEGQDFVTPLIEANPYKEILEKAEHIREKVADIDKAAGRKTDAKAAKAEAARLRGKFEKSPAPGAADARALINGAFDALSRIEDREAEIEDRLEELKAQREGIAPFVGFEYPLESVTRFRFISCRFGRFPKDAWNDFKMTIRRDNTTIFTKCTTDKDYIWGAFFVPSSEEAKADSLYAALRFEQVRVSSDYMGTPGAICETIDEEMKRLGERIAVYEKEIGRLFTEEKRDELYLAAETLSDLSHNFDARRLAVCIREDDETDAIDVPFFYTCGWMRKADAKKLRAELEENEEDIICVVNEKPEDTSLTPPTSIKNKGIFKPYEMYTKMYGLPNYKEFDPTVIIALLYSFIFGAMFGDLGHGLCLLLGGAVLYFVKRAPLAGIISFAGFFSSIFGLLYGSFFGFEDIIPALWLKPREAMSELNFIGRLNTVFAVAVLFGMLLMLALMMLNVVSHIKQKDFAGSLFTSNGIAGFVFYGTVVLIVVLYMTNKTLPANIIVIALIVLSALAMALSGPLTNLIKKKKAMETGVGMFCVEAFFDLFETVLTYFSNTLSFLRIGAFAISHAAMMEVVLSLGGYTEGSGNIAVLIIGNIIVMGFEGLIVGIQVLRLEYYEIFSKFYKGDGREFKPFFRKRRNS